MLGDLVRVMHHSFDADNYFARCAEVASRLNTVPKLVPGWRVFGRNARTFARLCVAMTRSEETRKPFWKALARVVRENRAGIEALARLSVLYVHFQAMLPYCYEKLAEQRAAIDALGEERWLARNLEQAPRAELALVEAS